MSLLFDFLKNLDEPELNRLKGIMIKGVPGHVFKQMMDQALKGDFDRPGIQKEVKISDTYFDKISSELLTNCYQTLFPDDPLALLFFLSLRVPFVKHYYQELNRQMKLIEKSDDKKRKSQFYKTGVDQIHFNMAIMNQRREMMEKLATKYLANVTSKEKAVARLWVNCRLCYHTVNNLFAEAQIRQASGKVFKELNQKIGNPALIKDDQLMFECYWVWIKYYVAIEDFSTGLLVAREALKNMMKFKQEEAKINRIRLTLKISEILYFNSNFEESFTMYRSIMSDTSNDLIPERGYHITKFIQICLITGHLKEAKNALNEITRFYKKRLYETLPIREIFSVIKYALFAGDYDRAFEHIQLGYQRNPKGKYFQYEIELRNLQVALFYLTGKYEEVLQMCERNIKFLRAHGYGVRESDYAYFYILTRTFIRNQATGKALTVLEKEKLERFNRGSYAVYGRLLHRMAQKK